MLLLAQPRMRALLNLVRALRRAQVPAPAVVFVLGARGSLDLL